MKKQHATFTFADGAYAGPVTVVEQTGDLVTVEFPWHDHRGRPVIKRTLLTPSELKGGKPCGRRQSNATKRS